MPRQNALNIFSHLVFITWRRHGSIVLMREAQRGYVTDSRSHSKWQRQICTQVLVTEAEAPDPLVTLLGLLICVG